MKKHGGYPGFIPRKSAKRKESNPTLQPEAREAKKKKFPKQKQTKLTVKTVKGVTTQAPYGVASDMKQSHNY